jgi:hypothetical protein
MTRLPLSRADRKARPRHLERNRTCFKMAFSSKAHSQQAVENAASNTLRDLLDLTD